MDTRRLTHSMSYVKYPTHGIGEIVLIRPISFRLSAWLTLLLICLLICFIALGTYTRRSTVQGELISNLGIVKVYATSPGVVIKKSADEQMHVREGDALYVLSSERQSSTRGAAQAAISAEVETRRQSLQEEFTSTVLLQQEERRTIARKQAALHEDMAALDAQIDEKKQQISLAQESYSRYQDLLSKDYISKETLLQKKEALLGQSGQLHDLERKKISANLELETQDRALSSLLPKQKNQLEVIKRDAATTEQQLTESEAKRESVILAPVTGIATGLNADIGQEVNDKKPLLSIVPAGAKLQAELYAPSRSIGFIRVGDDVVLRYQAYPYQKFGHGYGKVISISKAALSRDEQPIASNLPDGSNNSASSSTSNSTNGSIGSKNEPFYRVTVELNSQSINAYGESHQLQVGMAVDADLLQEKRHLYEWVLEPLYTVTGKL